jgi:signal transduction histidine kinase/ActR/RegA family two-component response regulator
MAGKATSIEMIEAQALQRRVMRVVALLMLVFGILVAASMGSDSGIPAWRIALNLTVSLVGVGGWWLLHVGRHDHAAKVLVWCFWLLITLSASLLGGLRAIALPNYVLVFVLSGWLLGRSQTYVMLGLTWMVLLIGYVGGEYMGWFPAAGGATGLLTLLFAHGVSIVAVAVVTNIAREGYLNQIAVIRKTADALALREGELRQLATDLALHRDQLENLVAKRTAELAIAKESAESANVAKSAFLANMSHEIRTPLNAISGLAHMIRSQGLMPAQSAQMDRLDKAGSHLNRVINDILDLSKIEAGKFILAKEPFRLESVAANVQSILHERLQKKGLQWVADLPQERMPPVLGDATRLQQALLNYVGNAIKFTERGCITLRIRLMEETEDDVLVRIEVEDMGVGIAPEVLSRLFTPFEQADNTLTRKHGGTGLGLTITKKIAELMGGEVGATSVPGQGSTFWFSARLRKAASEPSHVPVLAESVGAETILRRDHAGRRILLVEDDEMNQEVAKFQLQRVGLQVEIASDGIEAVAKATTGDYDLILMDMQMPRMNGLDATQAIRALPGYVNTPILAMTANAFAEDKIRCLEAGMDDFVVKPTAPNVLYKSLLQWLAATV